MAFKWTISDDYPRTLRGMASLIGAKNSAAPKSGLEKRIELDFVGASANSNPNLFNLTVNDLHDVLDSVDCKVVEEFSEEDIKFFLCDHCLIVVAPTKIIFTADSSVLIHKSLGPWTSLLKARDCKVEWSSFMRKNTTAPWSATDAILAEEYTELKHAFPEGNAFLFGPLDADHYFYYIFDGVPNRRSSADKADKAMDLQVNVALHDVQSDPVVEALGLRKTNKSGSVYQRCMAIAPGKYQTVRMLQDEQGSAACMLESNADSIPLATLVEQFCPSRFSVTFLVDPNCPNGETFDASALTFESYRKDVQMTNEFTGGYNVSKATFTRE